VRPYKIKDADELWNWRQKQIKEYPEIADSLVKRQFEKLLKEDRSIQKRIQVEKNGHNSKSIIFKIDLGKRKREDNEDAQHNIKKEKIET
jgi:hypothetical protein